MRERERGKDPERLPQPHYEHYESGVHAGIEAIRAAVRLRKWRIARRRSLHDSTAQGRKNRLWHRQEGCPRNVLRSTLEFVAKAYRDDLMIEGGLLRDYARP